MKSFMGILLCFGLAACEERWQPRACLEKDDLSAPITEHYRNRDFRSLFFEVRNAIALEGYVLTVYDVSSGYLKGEIDEDLCGPPAGSWRVSYDTPSGCSPYWPIARKRSVEAFISPVTENVSRVRFSIQDKAEFEDGRVVHDVCSEDYSSLLRMIPDGTRL